VQTGSLGLSLRNPFMCLLGSTTQDNVKTTLFVWRLFAPLIGQTCLP
jgi:hypothetical protein